MSSAAIISIKPFYANEILAGTKTIELRKSSMGLIPLDVILVYSSAPDQRLAFWFRVGKVETLPVAEMWKRHEDRLGIGREDYDAYFEGLQNATGLHVADVHQLQPVTLEEIQRLVPDFVPPQAIIWLKEEMGRYAQLLAKLSDPLPEDALPQLAFGFIANRSRDASS